MLYEFIENTYRYLLVWSPVIVLVALIGGFSAMRHYAWLALVIGIGVGFLGCTKIQPIERGSLGFGVFAYPFVFSWWFSIAYLFVLSVLAVCIKSLSRRRFWMISPAGTAGVLLVLFVLDKSYCKEMKKKAAVATKDYLSEAMNEEEFRATGFHKTQAFKEAATFYVKEHGYKLDVDRRDFLMSFGISVAQSRHSRRQQVDEALNQLEIYEKGNHRQKRLLYTVATNQNLKESDFSKLVKATNYDVLRLLIKNPSTDRDRMKMLKAQISGLMQALPDDDSNAYQKRKYQELLDYLEKVRQQKGF